MVAPELAHFASIPALSLPRAGLQVSDATRVHHLLRSREVGHAAVAIWEIAAESETLRAAVADDEGKAILAG
jgi:hypothetical protein